MRPFFYNFFQNIKIIFSGKNLLWHGLAILLTALIVTTDFDWKYFVFFRFIPIAYLAPAFAIGGLLPLILPFILLAWGLAKKSMPVLLAAYTLGQAALLGYLVSVFYKIFTGRIPPTYSLPGRRWVAQNAIDISHGFQLGFWRGGIFWGWPSSHTMVAFAMAVALIMLFPRSKSVKILAAIYALYIGFAVSISIHWLSEFIAGAIFGSLVGYVVGKSFYNKYAKQS